MSRFFKRFWLVIKSKVKEMCLMMAMFFAQRVILGTTEFKNVPKMLKPQVKQLLIESGLEALAVEE